MAPCSFDQLRSPEVTVQYHKKKIRLVDGFAIRNVFPDMDVVESRATSFSVRGDMPAPFVPEDEIWVDRRFKDELDFLLEVHRLEQLKRDWPYKKIRAYLKEKLCDKRPMPPHVVSRTKQGRITVCRVRGELVRRHLDPSFIFGGHDLVYDYIPENEVWLDIRQDQREVRYTLLHELHERKLMARGATYDRAHASATEIERRARRRELEPRREQPLKIRHFRQTPGLCGPASLKMACSCFGREYDESTLAALCKATPEYGTDHADLMAAAESLGAKVFSKAGGTVADLRKYVVRKRLPVIIGWYSPDDPRKTAFVTGRDKYEDHFSVVYHVTDAHVWIMDPGRDRGRRRIPIARFLRMWWDTDGPDDTRVERWFMTLTFDGKTL